MPEKILLTTQPLRMFEKYWKPGTSKVLTLAILLTLLFFGASFYLYVSQNYSYLVERNFRLLATWSQELTETIDNYESSFRFRIQEQKSANVPKSSPPIRSRAVRQTLTNTGLVLNGFARNAESNDTSRKKSKKTLAQQAGCRK